MDTKTDVWTVPAAPMKTLFAHRVPLCGRSIEILDAARTLGTGGNPLVFPARRGRQLDTSPAVAHGFRSTFRDWAAEETDHPREGIKAALAHVVGNKVEAAYARSDLFEQRGASWTIGKPALPASARPGRDQAHRRPHSGVRPFGW